VRDRERSGRGVRNTKDGRTDVNENVDRERKPAGSTEEARRRVCVNRTMCRRKKQGSRLFIAKRITEREREREREQAKKREKEDGTGCIRRNMYMCECV
jgi:hypothetical protein